MYPECSKCNFENQADAKFCKQCGVLLRVDKKPEEQIAANVKCEKCGFENTLNAKFCNQCGTRIEAPRPRSAPDTSGAQGIRPFGLAYELGSKLGWLPTWARVSVVAGGMLLIFICIVIIIGITRPSTSPSSVAFPTSAPNHPLASSSQPQAPSFSGNLSTAKTYLESPLMKDELEAAKRELELIPATAPEYKEAQSLLTQIKNGKIRYLPEIPGFESASSRLYEKFMNIDSSITYEKLKKNADRFTGKAWGFTGKVLEIYEQGNSTIARVGTGAYGMNVVFVEGDFTTDFVANNRVYVLGDISGSKTYESQAGWQITIPQVQAVAMLNPGDVAKLQAAKR